MVVVAGYAVEYWSSIRGGVSSSMRGKRRISIGPQGGALPQ